MAIMSIEPDAKDWTWVLEERCPECGFDSATFPAERVGEQVLADLPRWQAALSRPGADARPSPEVWSTTEYACHVRDVFGLFAQRLTLMLERDDPEFANWDQDATAIEDDYASQRAPDVSSQLTAAGVAAAERFSSVPDDAWERVGRRSNGSGFTVTTLLQYALHDVVHHLHDVRA